jgi:hypothetical protein
MSYGAILVGIAVFAGVLALIFRDQIAALSSNQVASVVMLVMALMVVAGPALSGRGRDLGPNWLRNILIWLSVAAAIALVYSAAEPFLPEGFGMR